MASGTVIRFGLSFTGIEHLRSTRASMVATLEPFSAGILSLVLFGVVFGAWRMFEGLTNRA